MKYKIKDSGKRASFNTGMIRDSSDKIRYDLVPLFIINRFAEHLTKGAKKYTSSVDCSTNSVLDWIRKEVVECLLNVQTIQIRWFMRKDCVDPVMRLNYGKIIQTLQKGNSKTEEHGQDVIQKDLKNYKRKGKQILNVEQEISIQDMLHRLEKGDLQNKQLNYYWKNNKINVEFAEETFQYAQSILTMTIIQNLQEVTYVVGAITVLECLKSLLKCLNKQYNILQNIQLENLQNDIFRIIIPGERNWEKARTKEELERFIASAERHFNDWLKGYDDEDHVSALIFNLCGAEMVIAKLNEEEIDMGPLENIKKRRLNE